MVAKMNEEWSQWITLEESATCEPRRQRRSFTTTDTLMQKRLSTTSVQASSSSMSLGGASASPRRIRNESESSSASLNSSSSASDARIPRTRNKGTRNRRKSAAEKLLSPKNEAMLLKILEVNKLGNAEVLERIRVKESEKEIKRTTSLSGIIKKLSFSSKKSASK